MGKCFKWDKMNILITGHCGFIGKACWDFFKQKHNVFGIDNLHRKGTKLLEDKNSYLLNINDINDLNIPKIDWVIHLAAQVSVVDSQINPTLDFDYNAKGTFNIIQWAKKQEANVIYSSTNKVFGTLSLAYKPICDSQPFYPETNYGVSKSAGAFYVNDYKNGWVFHQSCIYGENQMGDENQGWIGWLRQCIKNKKEITCYGTGKQIRDLLHVDDLVNLYNMTIKNEIPKGSYIVGGGIDNAFSFEKAVNLMGGKISHYKNFREKDQLYFVSNNDIQKYGWKPTILFKDLI